MEAVILSDRVLFLHERTAAAAAAAADEKGTDLEQPPRVWLEAIFQSEVSSRNWVMVAI